MPPLSTISAADLAEKLEKHVVNRGGATLQNGAWDMMLLASEILLYQAEQMKVLRQCVEAERQENGRLVRLLFEAQGQPLPND